MAGPAINLTVAHKEKAEQHIRLEKMLINNLDCLDDDGELTSLPNYIGHSKNCHDSFPKLLQQDPGITLWVILVLVLGSVSVFSIIAFLVIRTRVIDRKMRKRACSRFIVPTTLPTMGSLSLERAASIEETFPQHVSVETEETVEDYPGDSYLLSRNCLLTEL